MKAVFFTLLLAVIVVVQCTHTFVGTNVHRPMVYHNNFYRSAKVFKKTVDNQYYQIPNLASNYGRTIQGILAVDMTNTEASANITQGGVGYNYVNIRMKSERGHKLHYDIFIYA